MERKEDELTGVSVSQVAGGERVSLGCRSMEPRVTLRDGYVINTVLQ